MGGGIGEGLASPNISDENFTERFWFDILFFILLIVLLLNIVTGIIIDTFAQLRD